MQVLPDDTQELQQHHIDHHHQQKQPKENRSNQNVIENKELAFIPVETESKEAPPLAPIRVADIIGEYGFYQLSLTLLTFIRYVCCAMMTNTGPLIAPDVEFWCQVDNATVINLIKIPDNHTMDQYLQNKCSFKFGDDEQFECNHWRYNQSQYGVTLTDTFNLVCHQNWLRSALQSTISVGVVVASVMGGSISDKYGRYFTVKLSFICALVCGTISYLTDNFILYTLSRALCTFGDLGLVVSLATIIVETMGNKYRGAVCIIVYTGWAFGVMVMPFLTDYFRDYRQLMLFTIICHLLTLPWLMTVGESVRWLLVNGKIEEARTELRRISKWNSKGDEKALENVDKKFNILKIKFVKAAEIKASKKMLQENQSRIRDLWQTLSGGLNQVDRLFKSRRMALATISIVWVSFTSELFYMLFILINSDIGDNVKLNYAIGGVMETLATFLALLMIAKMSRKSSLLLTMITIACCCAVLACYHQVASLSVFLLNGTKLAISTLSSIVFVVTTEIFPTNMRQTGFGLCGTLSSLGAVLAPFIRTELVNLIGMTYVMLMLIVMPLVAIILIPLFLRETKGVELSDDVDEIEAELDNNTQQQERVTRKI